MPPLALMGLIFFLSAQPSLTSGLGDLDLLLRKLAHMTEFGVLALLWWRALNSAPAGAMIAIVYAITDEFHQTFVSGRHGTPVDVLIDAVGVGLGILAWRATASRARWR